MGSPKRSQNEVMFAPVGTLFDAERCERKGWRKGPAIAKRNQFYGTSLMLNKAARRKNTSL